MNAPVESSELQPTARQARVLAELAARVDELIAERNALLRTRDDLIDQLTGCRNTVARQQAEFEQWRLRPAPRPARRTQTLQLPKD